MLFRKKCMQIYNPRISMHQFIVITAHLLCRNAPTHYFGCYQTCFIHFFYYFCTLEYIGFQP